MSTNNTLEASGLVSARNNTTTQAKINNNDIDRTVRGRTNRQIILSLLRDQERSNTEIGTVLGSTYGYIENNISFEILK